MAESTSDAPVITQGQTTSAANGAHATEIEPVVTDAVQEPAPSIWSNWLLWAVIAMWIWFLFGNKKRRQAKAQEKQERARREALVKGDKLITIGRMHGTVVGLTDTTVTVKPDPKSDYTMTFDRQAIFRVLPRPGEEDPAATDAAAK